MSSFTEALTVIGYRYSPYSLFVFQKHNVEVPAFVSESFKIQVSLFKCFCFICMWFILRSGAPLQDKQLWCLLSVFSLIVHKPKRSVITARKKKTSEMTGSSFLAFFSLFSPFHVVSHLTLTHCRQHDWCVAVFWPIVTVCMLLQCYGVLPWHVSSSFSMKVMKSRVFIASVLCYLILRRQLARQNSLCGIQINVFILSLYCLL